MKKLFFVFSVLTTIALSSMTAFAIDGDGTEESPFLITNQAELELVSDFPNYHFKLANNIRLEGIWIPLCTQISSGYFSGVFDGAGYTISNLTTADTEGGLFKYNSGTIKDLKVILSANGVEASKENIGIISGKNNGEISNCLARGNIINTGSYTGGITGYNTGTISKCRYEGVVTNNGGMSGGITAYNGKTISNCAVAGDINSSTIAGGIAGTNYVADISNSYFIGSVNGNEKSVGIAQNSGFKNYQSYGSNWVNPQYHWVYYEGNITNCYAAPTFSSNESIYAISAYSEFGNTTGCYYDKTVSGLTSTNCGTPKSTAAMKMIQTYQANWNFDTVWGIDKNINDGYPYLLWESESTDSQITFDTATQTATAYLAESGTYTVIFADYNGNTFVKTDIQPLTLKRGYNRIPTTLRLTNGDKVFLWNGLTTLAPICEAAIVSSK